MFEYILATSDEEYRLAAQLFSEYAVAINIDLAFQHFDEELSTIREMYGSPEGGIILCKTNNGYAGCVGIRKIDAATAELKRMYVKPAFQNRKIGKELLRQAIMLAKKCNYKTIRLDTLNYMLPAIHLYTQHGFYEIPAYYFNPNTTAVFFEMKL
jgi:GNAT superfamily N-acetyltransferase